MASVTWQGFTGLVQGFVAGVQAAAKAIVDTTVGSVTLALGQANSAMALFLQGQAAQVTALTRLATSFNGDVDTFVNTFGMSRLGATYATTTETFARFTATNSALIPAGSGAGAGLAGGAIVSTGPGGVQFMVTADPTNSLWNAAQGGYLVPANTSSATVPIQCLTAGTAGNVLAGTISSFFAPIAGIDTCANPADVVNGLPVETDAAVKTRFPLYLAGLATGNAAAIEAAIAGVQQGLQCLVIENQAPVGSSYPFYDAFTYFDAPGSLAYPTLIPWPGRFFVVVDDGSGSPPLSLLQRCATAVDAIRGLTIEYNVIGPVKVIPPIQFSLTPQPGFVKSTLSGQAAIAVQNWLNSLPLGTPLIPLTRIPQVVYDAAPGVANVPLSSIAINGVAQDLALNAVQVAKAGTVTVN